MNKEEQKRQNKINRNQPLVFNIPN